MFPFPNACSTKSPYSLMLSVQQGQFQVELSPNGTLTGIMTLNVTLAEVGAWAAGDRGCEVGNLVFRYTFEGTKTPYQALQFSGVLTDTCVLLSSTATVTDPYGTGTVCSATYMLSGTVGSDES